MPLDLPRVLIRTESFDPVVVESCPEVSDTELAVLVNLDRGTVPSGTADRCVPLARPSDPGGARWAVGQRRGDDTLWRVVGSADAERLGGHPAWLWTAEAWFDPSLGRDPRARSPAALPLRHLVRLMAPVGGRNRRTMKALASVISALRAGTPAALVVDPDLLTSASHPARWLVLGLLAILPPARRESLRVSIGDSNANPASYDLAVTSTPPGGFLPIEAANPPDDGDDLVAYYVRNRLYDDDPEALEAAAYLFDGEGDRWGDGIAALIRDGLPGVSEVTTEMIEQDPERAVRAIAARLRAGAPLDPALVDQLVQVTLKTRDARPWRALGRRTALQRADAVDALLNHRTALRPGPELVTELCTLYPRGAPVELWIPALLGWLSGGTAADAAVAGLQTTLLEWPLSATGAIRASVWGDVVTALVQLGRETQAIDALVGPVAREIARDGAGHSIVASWASVPPGSRAPERIDALVDLLHGVPGGDRATAELFRSIQGNEPEARALIRAWVRRAASSPSADDPVYAAVKDTPHLQTWAEVAMESTSRAGAPDRWAPQKREPLWTEMADVLVERAHDPRGAVLALAQLRAPAVATERALPLALAAVVDARFPDAELAAAAEILARAAGASPIWAWLAVTAAAPDVWDDATIDATVVAFCSQELDQPTLTVALSAVERLGRASGWEPLDHARWLVRMALAPEGGGNAPLIVALLEGIRSRDDSIDFMAGLLRPMLDLPPDHPASQLLIEELPEAGWQGRELGAVIDAVGRMNIPLSVRRTLLALAEPS